MPLPVTFILTGRSGSHLDRSIKTLIQNPAHFTHEEFLEWLFKVTNAPAECLNDYDNLTLEANKEALKGKL